MTCTHHANKPSRQFLLSRCEVVDHMSNINCRFPEPMTCHHGEIGHLVIGAEGLHDRALGLSLYRAGTLACATNAGRRLILTGRCSDSGTSTTSPRSRPVINLHAGRVPVRLPCGELAAHLGRFAEGQRLGGGRRILERELFDDIQDGILCRLREGLGFFGRLFRRCSCREPSKSRGMTQVTFT